MNYGAPTPRMAVDTQHWDTDPWGNSGSVKKADPQRLEVVGVHLQHFVKGPQQNKDRVAVPWDKGWTGTRRQERPRAVRTVLYFKLVDKQTHTCDKMLWNQMQARAREYRLNWGDLHSIGVLSRCQYPASMFYCSF